MSTPRENTDQRIRRIGLPKAGTELKVAAILFTYRCTIACRHCLFGCAAKRPDVVMDAARCVQYLGQLHRLGRVVHIAGGEAMMYWDVLKEVLERAHPRGLAPHFIESNCSFAANDAIVRERFEFFQRMGVFGVYLSTDPYHQQFVSPEHFLRARRIAGEIFGRQNVWCSGAGDQDVREHAAIARDGQRLAEFVRKHPPQMVGTAARELSPLLPSIPLDPATAQPRQAGAAATEAFNQPCRSQFVPVGIWEIHIDPYDNIQTNCGVIVGNATKTPVDELMADGLLTSDIVRVLSVEGPAGLARWARDRHGYVVPPAVCQKCELCYRTRSFLRRFHPEVLGPAELYP